MLKAKMTGLHQSDQNELKNKSKWKETIKQTWNRVRYSVQKHSFGIYRHTRTFTRTTWFGYSCFVMVKRNYWFFLQKSGRLKVTSAYVRRKIEGTALTSLTTPSSWGARNCGMGIRCNWPQQGWIWIGPGCMNWPTNELCRGSMLKTNKIGELTAIGELLTYYEIWT